MIKHHFQLEKAFYSNVNLEDIIDKDYTHAQNVFREFDLKNVGNYHDLYVQRDTLLFADVFENLETSVLKYMNLIIINEAKHKAIKRKRLKI